MGLGEEERVSFTASADMEVDSTFNAEQHTGMYLMCATSSLFITITIRLSLREYSLPLKTLPLGPGKLFPMIHPLFYSFIPKISAYSSLKPAHYSHLFPKHY